MLPRRILALKSLLPTYGARLLRRKSGVAAAEESADVPSTEDAVRILQEYFAKRNVVHPYVVDYQVCDTIVKCLRNAGVFSDDVPLILGSPGLGHLANAVLEAGAHKVIAMSDTKQFLKYLRSLQNKYSEARLKLYWCKILSPGTLGPAFHFITDATGRHIPELKDPDVEVPWTTERPPFRLFGIFSDVNKEMAYMARLLFTAPVGEGLFVSGRTECFLVVSDWCWKIISGAIPNSKIYPSLRMYPVLSKVFFDLQHLEKFNRNSFYPVRPVVTKKWYCSGDLESMHLIRFRPSADVWSRCCDQKHADGFLFYVRQLLYNTRRSLLPIIEEWMPGSGLEMALLGYPITAWISDLDVDDLIKIYRALEKRSGFEATLLSKGYQFTSSEMPEDLGPSL